MSRWIDPAHFVVFLLATVCLSGFAMAGEVRTGPGKPVTAETLAIWDIDVRSDGKGLPSGHGSVEQGEEVYAEKCAACHGDFGEGVGRVPGLFGGVGSLGSEAPSRRVGSLWPHAPTLFDYIRRTMPFGNAQSLSDDETWALTAYVLNMNELWEEDAKLNRDNLPGIQMPNNNGFVLEDPRPDVANPRCMRDCRSAPKITTRAVLVSNTEDQ